MALTCLLWLNLFFFTLVSSQYVPCPPPPSPKSPSHPGGHHGSPSKPKSPPSTPKSPGHPGGQYGSPSTPTPAPKSPSHHGGHPGPPSTPKTPKSPSHPGGGYGSPPSTPKTPKSPSQPGGHYGSPPAPTIPPLTPTKPPTPPPAQMIPPPSHTPTAPPTTPTIPPSSPYAPTIPPPTPITPPSSPPPTMPPPTTLPPPTPTSPLVPPPSTTPTTPPPITLPPPTPILPPPSLSPPQTPTMPPPSPTPILPPPTSSPPKISPPTTPPSTPPTPSPSTGGKCPINILKLAACANVLPSLLDVVLGTPPKSECCSVLEGLADLDAAICICTALEADILGIHLNVPVSLTVLLNFCNKAGIPDDFKCPTTTSPPSTSPPTIPTPITPPSASTSPPIIPTPPSTPTSPPKISTPISPPLTPPSTGDKCPIDTLKLGACASVLPNLLDVVLGTPPKSECCSILEGLTDLDAAICLCTTLEANILGINLNIPVSLTVLLNFCNKAGIPDDYKCPTTSTPPPMIPTPITPPSTTTSPPAIPTPITPPATPASPPKIVTPISPPLTPPSTGDKCPINTLKLGACASVLPNLLDVVLGTPPKSECCSILEGLTDLDAAICLCTALEANILGINLNIPISLTVLLNFCNKAGIPDDYKCPTTSTPPPMIPTPITPPSTTTSPPAIPTPITPPTIPTLPPSIPTPITPPLTPPATSPSMEDKCPINTLKLGACANVLPSLLDIVLGTPPKTQCCSVLDGLTDLDAALCLCTAVKANILGINLDVDVSVNVLLNFCDKAGAASDFQCP